MFSVRHDLADIWSPAKDPVETAPVTELWKSSPGFAAM
jgi:hypothetical protein